MYQVSHVASGATSQGALASDPGRNLLCSSAPGARTRSKRTCLVESHVASGGTRSGPLASDPGRNLRCSSGPGACMRSSRTYLVESHVTSGGSLQVLWLVTLLAGTRTSVAVPGPMPQELGLRSRRTYQKKGSS